MVVRSGLIDEFDAVDELSGLAEIVKPVSVPDAEQLVPEAKTILASKEGIGFQRLEVHGATLVVRVVSEMLETARQRIQELGLRYCRAE